VKFIDDLSPLLESVNAEDTEGFLDSFTDDAVVDDEGHRYQGLLQIAEWNTRHVIGAHLRVRALTTPVPTPDGDVTIEVQAAGTTRHRLIAASWRQDRIERLRVRTPSSH
jgi:hypothetical protein